MIIRFDERAPIFWIRNNFPNSFLKRIKSWNREKELIESNAKGGKLFEIDDENKRSISQEAQRRYCEQRKLMSKKRYRGELASIDKIKSLYDITEIKKNGANKKHKLATVSEHPDRKEKEVIELEKELPEKE